MTRRETRKYALNVLRARENLRKAKIEAGERLAAKFALQQRHHQPQLLRQAHHHAMNRRRIRKMCLDAARKMADVRRGLEPSSEIFYLDLIHNPKKLRISFTVTPQGAVNR